jgi:nicotinate-nucleotide adenylyltransferase
MRVGIFGGTFDPIHLAHLVVAEQTREQAQLDQVWFLPSYQPPHKQKHEIVSFERRVEMIALAIAGNPIFRVETIEKERVGPSYTADTLDALQARHPDAELHLVVGADCLPDLRNWYQPLRIIDRVKLLVSSRPTFPLWTSNQLAESLNISPDRVRMQVIDLPLIDLASHELRERVQGGRTVKYLVPHAVEVYIREKRLYA